MERNKFEIIVPCMNNPYLTACLNSITSQDYPDINVHAIIDPYPDYGFHHPKVNDELLVTINNERLYALSNIMYALSMNYLTPDTIIVIVDGDDELFDTGVISYLNEIYVKHSPWLTYGGQVRKYGSKDSYHLEITIENPSRYRTVLNDAYWVHHLFTFRKWLYDKIDKSDFRDEEGRVFVTSYDRALMYPMIEMAGSENMFHTKHPCYVYNTSTPDNDYKVRKPLQEKTTDYIRNKKRYDPL